MIQTIVVMYSNLDIPSFSKWDISNPSILETLESKTKNLR